MITSSRARRTRSAVPRTLIAALAVAGLVSACAPGGDQSSSSASSASVGTSSGAFTAVASSAGDTGSSAAAGGSGSSGAASSASGSGSAAGSATGSASASGTGSAGAGDQAVEDLGDAAVKAAGKVDLVIWDQENTPGTQDVLVKLNDEFQKKYPNVTIKRTVKNLNDLKATLKLAISGDNPPDVVEANQGYSDMAAFVKAKLLTPLTDYDKTYHWSTRIPAAELALNSVTPDGGTLGTGDVYGISATGEVVGIYYNKEKLAKLGLKPPTTFEEMTAQFDKIKGDGEVPIQFGNSDKWPAIHLLGAVVGAQMGQQDPAKLVFGQAGEWTTDGMKTAAATISDWAKKGYLVTGFAGQTNDLAVENYSKGTGVYFIGGTWNQAIFEKGLGTTNVGFTVLPGKAGGKPASLGGIGFPWAIPAKSKNKDVAAAYINFITSPHAMTMLAKNQQLPAVLPSDFSPEAGTLAAEVWDTWKEIGDANGLIPYLDWATPTFYDTITAQLQILLAGKEDPAAFTTALQADYSGFHQ